MPSISVIIPTYNRCDVLKRAVDSVISQTLSPDEIIVVDDGSVDGTREMLQREYPSITLLVQDNKGVSTARNKGIEYARGTWLALLDSDDKWHEDKMAKQMTAVNAHPGYLIAHSDEIWMRNSVRVNQMKKHKKYGGQIFRRCLPLCAISPSSVIIHRSIFENIGLFDENLPVCEDYDMWLRICARYPVLFINEALITKFGGHEDQLSRKYHGMDRFRIRAIEKILNENILSEADRYAAMNMLREKIGIYLNGARKRGNGESIKEMESLIMRFNLEENSSTVPNSQI